MNEVFQKTIAKECSIEGTGLHTGAHSTVRFKPAPVNAGIQFHRNGSRVDSNVVNETRRCTVLGSETNRVQTVEHLLATFSGLGITNILVDIDGPEVPGLDGSAIPFVRILKEAGILNQSEKKEIYKIKEPIFCFEGKKAISIYPADEFRVNYLLDYDCPGLRNQTFEFVLNPKNFENEIAPARTFCTEKEGAELKKMGFGSGATYENTLVFSEAGPIQNKLRFSDECARHKVLDVLGDLSLLGFAVAGCVIGIRSGHSLNRKLVQEILAQREKTKERGHD